MHLAFITVARSDFSRLLPTLKKVNTSSEHDLHLMVAGNHESEQFGQSITEITEQKLPINCQIKCSEVPASKSAEILQGVSEYISENKLDYLVILGDRFEMLAAAQAATLARLPIIHIGGGYKTAGAFDDSIRHAITQLSSVHMVATEGCLQRVTQMGVETQRTFLTGAPDLEILEAIETLERHDFCQEVGLPKDEDFVLVTLHPETLATPTENRRYIKEFEKFLSTIDVNVLITAPCADPGADEIFKMIDRCKTKKGFVYRQSLGGRLYINALRQAAVVIGNSSSGIIEAGSFNVPVINIGCRQEGREQNGNVVNCEFSSSVLSDEFHKLLSGSMTYGLGRNIYGDSQFSDRFLKICSKLN
jgi:UDP-hydrolysing UDP-N-acetyl-D-glucosamine 2-epimerase